MNLKVFSLQASVLALAACASAKTSDTAGAAPSSSVAVASGGQVKWVGSLQPIQQASSGLGPTGQNKAFGTVTLSSKGTERTAISISVSTPLSGSTTLRWAVLPGQCGTGSLPIVGVERFPQIDVGNNGRGQLNTEMALSLPTNGSYHVNIYWANGQQLSDVMTCANLRKS
jgi:hypothetical protein